MMLFRLTPMASSTLLVCTPHAQTATVKTQPEATELATVIVNTGAECDVPEVREMPLTGRAIHTPSPYADPEPDANANANANAANTMTLPSWSRLDQGARYITRAGAQVPNLRARVDTVTDRIYWASAGGYPGANYQVLGAPGTFVLSGTIDL